MPVLDLSPLPPIARRAARDAILALAKGNPPATGDVALVLQHGIALPELQAAANANRQRKLAARKAAG